MKRPPGLWVLLSAGVLLLSLQDAFGIRATSLIFGKSATTTTASTTTSTTTTAAPEQSDESTEPDAANATKPTLTGIPQVDYIWDPNLPKELNGYNLSDYPFYERVPEDIDFKCDGLHDGFYASVKHKCQVYHHCLFGVRYDFLCANYTAFDQTLFNCNFVSNVDCQNSKKFWHRNDDLYVAKSTTTASPPPAYNFYTPPPEAYSPLTPSVPLQAVPPLPPLESPRRRGRLPARRRPQYEIYDEEDYEERPRMNRRKRPRPRPIYYDDYEEYEDERFERRGGGGGRRRRPYDRRPSRRDKDRRRKYDYEDEEDSYEDYTADKKQKNNKRRKYLDDYEEEDERYEKRRTKPTRKTKRPNDDDYEDYGRKEKRRDITEEQQERKPLRLGVRRPPSEEHEDDLQQAEPKSYERTRKSNREGVYKKLAEENSRTVIKPVSGTIYDRPRLAPKINLPVPKNAADKFAYKPINSPPPRSTTTNTQGTLDEDYTESTLKTNKRPKMETKPPTTVVRKFKRPFLPSRGGSPYTPRALQPVGDVEERQASSNSDSEDNKDEDEIQVGRPDMKQIPVTVKSPLAEKEGPIRIKVPIRGKMIGQPTTEAQKLSDEDILNGNYDVTINEALSPVLPIRGYPSGFSSNNDYIYQKPTKYVILDPVVSAGGSYYVK